MPTPTTAQIDAALAALRKSLGTTLVLRQHCLRPGDPWPVEDVSLELLVTDILTAGLADTQPETGHEQPSSAAEPVADRVRRVLDGYGVREFDGTCGVVGLDRLVADVIDATGCCSTFWCPTVDAVECPTHGGFDVCCDRPDLHRATAELACPTASPPARG